MGAVTNIRPTLSVDDEFAKATTWLWAEREAQIRGVIEATAGMYSDLQSIAGRSLQEIDGLDMQLLEPPKQNGNSLEDSTTAPQGRFSNIQYQEKSRERHLDHNI